MRSTSPALALHLVDPERFWSCVEVAGEKDCWPWSCARTDKGYGSFYVLGRTVGSHRVAWSLHHGRSPGPRIVIRHTCDNPPCVNPLHLVSGTQADHNREIAARRRHRAYNSIAIARALVDGATAADLVAIFGMHLDTAAEYVRLGPEGVVHRRAARGVRIPAPHTRRRRVANEAALAAAQDGATVEQLVSDHGLSRATAYRYLARAQNAPAGPQVA
jgi:hypothetical protein